MKMLLKPATFALLLVLVACGGKETANNITSKAEASTDITKEASVTTAMNHIETTNTAVEELPSASTEKEMSNGAGESVNNAAAATKEDMHKVAKQVEAVAKKETVSLEKVTSTASTSATKAKEMVVAGAKEVAGKATNAAEMVIEKAKEVPAAASTTKEAAAKIIETPVQAAKKVVQKETVQLKPSTVDHSSWDQLLQKYVSAAGKVNYKGIKSDKGALEAYLKLLSENPIQDSWSRSDKMAYWINAYNAFTIKLIVDNYPITSITKLHGGKAWDHPFIKLGSKTYTLNDIENKTLRPQFKDARIHFAVNCAAKSCPPILNKAWTAANLNSNLDRQAKSFINNAAYNTISPNKIEVSKIFEWYKEDFGDLVSFLNKYANNKIAAGAAVQFKEYEWALNE